MTNFFVFWKMRTAMAIFWYLIFELSAVDLYMFSLSKFLDGILNRFTQPQHSTLKSKI